MTAATKVIEVVHDTDPKKVIWKALEGQLERIESLTSGDCLLCIYERPQKMKSGLYMPETASRVTEDKFQGCVGLLVKTGPDFAKHRQALCLDKMPKLGSWIFFRRQDAVTTVVGERVMCLLQGDYIRMVLKDPDVVV